MAAVEGVHGEFETTTSSGGEVYWNGSLYAPGVTFVELSRAHLALRIAGAPDSRIAVTGWSDRARRFTFIGYGWPPSRTDATTNDG